jgi:PII-like signaling protein
MKAMEGEQTLMRIFLGERDRVHGRPLADVLVELFRAEGFAGATVLRGTQGFGAHSRTVHRDSILRLSEDLPVVLEVVDTEEKIRGILPRLEEMMGGGLITFERVHVIRYRGHDR